ncbi:MAG: hypothetical protein K6G79_03820 [Bacteroidales bacterium]|nr:hypothetical protein [Bacteroidales bacterium]
MRKAFVFLAAALLALAACQPDPVLTLDKNSLEFDAKGGSLTVYVTSNYEWNTIVEGKNFTVSPASGVESGHVTITASPNNTSVYLNGQVVFVCNNKNMSATQILNITQSCPSGSAKFDNWPTDPVPATGGSFTATVNANGAWTIDCDAADVKISKVTGDAGISTTQIDIPVNPGFDARGIKFTLSCRTAAGSASASHLIKQEGGVLSYAGETYKAVKMKDGKWWMAENLRYVPSGMTVSDDAANASAGIWYPVVIDELTPDKASVKFSKDAADIKANGYLYSTEVALGSTPGGITADNAVSLEGTRGICPEGWHIPTLADIIGLVGKTADKNDTNPDAPYYDANLNGGNGSAAMLNADGFNAGAWGAVSIANAAAAKGTLMGAIKAYQGGMNTGYIAGSTMHQVTKNDDGTLKNVQYVGLMPNMNNGTYNGAWNNYRNGVTVRCVKNN